MSVTATETETLQSLRNVEERILQDQQYLSGIASNLRMTGSEVYLSNRYSAAANQLSRALNDIRERISRVQGNDFNSRLGNE